MREKRNECCCQPLKEEFQRSKFSLLHDEPGDFCRSQWQRGERSFLWVIYRWLLAAFYAGGVIGGLVQEFNHGKWFIYLTDWGFSLCFFTSVFGAVITTIYYINRNHFKSGSLALKIYWISHYTSLVLALVITLVYWSAIYPSLEDDEPIGLYNYWEHAFNSVGMFIDCFMVRFPTRLMHFMGPPTVIVTYGIFSLIYYFSGGTDIFGEHFIYFILDWERPGLAIGSICGVILVSLIFCLVAFGLYRLRLCIYESCIKPQESQVTQPRRAASKETC